MKYVKILLLCPLFLFVLPVKTFAQFLGESVVCPEEDYSYTLHTVFNYGAVLTLSVKNGYFPEYSNQTSVSIGASSWKGWIKVRWNDVSGNGSLSCNADNCTVNSCNEWMSVTIKSIKDQSPSLSTDRFPIQNDEILIPIDESGTFECRAALGYYGGVGGFIDYFNWSVGASSWRGEGKQTIRYSEYDDKNIVISVTPLKECDSKNVSNGKTKTVTVRRTPVTLDVKNLTINSNKEYKFKRIFIENVTITNNAEVYFGSYDTIRVSAPFHAQLGTKVHFRPGDPTVNPGNSYASARNSSLYTVIDSTDFILASDRVLSETNENRTLSSLDDEVASFNLEKRSSSLFQNEPNPFNVHTFIRYYVSEDVNVARIQIFSLTGQPVKTLMITERGEGAIYIDSSELSPGFYLYSLIVDDKIIDTKRMTVIR